MRLTESQQSALRAVILSTADSPAANLLPPVLEELGVRAMLSHTVDDTVEVCRVEPISLVFVRLPLQDASAPALFQALRRLPNGLDMLLVAIIEADNVAAVAETMEAGADGFLEAGTPRNLLGIRVGALVQRARNRAETGPEGRDQRDARIRAMLDNMPVAAFTIDPDGRLLYANPAMEKCFGYGPGELTQKRLDLLFTPDKEEMDPDERAPVRGQGRREDGSAFPLLMNRRDLPFGDGTLPTGFIQDLSPPPPPAPETSFTQGAAAASEAMPAAPVSATPSAPVSAAPAAAQEVPAPAAGQAPAPPSEPVPAAVPSPAIDDFEIALDFHDRMLLVLNGLKIGAAVLDRDGRMLFLNEMGLKLCRKRPVETVGRPWQECLPLTAQQQEQLADMMATPEAIRTRVPVHTTGDEDQDIWMDVEISENPFDQGGTLLFLYDRTEVHTLRRMLEGKAGFHEMVGKTRPMKRIFEQIREFGTIDWAVLIEGEPGTGKELAARAVHSQSPRADRAFVVVATSGVSEAVLRNQLFGYLKGAFDGALADSQGAIERAEGGTVFIDEVGDLPVSLQAELAAVMEGGEYTPVGAPSPRPADVRFIVATSRTGTDRDIHKEAAEGRFRNDLLSRIGMARISLPALRERRADIPLIITATLARSRAVSGKAVSAVSGNAMRLLTRYPWPGNVRELVHAIEFAATRARGELINSRDLPPEIAAPRRVELIPPGGPEDERSRILAALEQASGNRARAARLLGISRATLYRKLDALRIPHKA